MAYGAIIMAAAQMGYGIYQNQRAKRQLEEAEKNKPMYKIPEGIRKNLSDAQYRALEGLPEEQRKNFIQQIQRSSINATQKAADRRSGLAGLSGIHQQEIDAYGNLLSKDVQARQANQRQLMNQNNIMARYEDKEFGINRMDPYIRDVNQAQALQGAGLQNMMRGATQGVGALESHLHNNAAFEAMYGNKKENGMDTTLINKSMGVNTPPTNPSGLNAVPPTTVNNNQILPENEFAFNPTANNFL